MATLPLPDAPIPRPRTIATRARSSSLSPRRVVRSLAVEAVATRVGILSKLYCKVSLSDSEATLIELLPTSRLGACRVYALPLHLADSKDDEETAQAAARALDIPLGGHGPDGPTDRSTRSETGSLDQCRRGSDLAEVTIEARTVVLRRKGNVAARTRSANGLSDGSFGRPRSRSRSRASSPDEAGDDAALELVVVLEIETHFGGLQLPKFANTVTLPVPPCLRNTISLVLPSPPSNSPSWDLSVRPPLSNAQSSPASRSSTTMFELKGSFPSTSSLILRWTPQSEPGAGDPVLRVPEASLRTTWEIDERGLRTAHVTIDAPFEYAGLRDKHVVDIECRGLDGQDQVDVSRVDGDGVIGWDIVRPGNAQDSGVGPHGSRFNELLPTDDDFASALDDSLVSHETPSNPRTPTPSHRRRRSSAHDYPVEPRPLSYTSLFDTAPPAPPDLDVDASLLVSDLANGKLEKSPSLLRQPAPFDSESSVAETSFEEPERGGRASSPARDEVRPELAGTATDAAQRTSPSLVSTTIRVHVSLTSLLRPTLGPTPSLSFRLVAILPAPPRSSSTAVNAPLDLFLPSFSLTIAEREQVVSSAAARGSTVELIQPSMTASAAPASPLPAVGGEARWAISRTRFEPLPDAVRVEVAQPFVGVAHAVNQSSTSRADLDEAPPTLDVSAMTLRRDLEDSRESDQHVVLHRDVATSDRRLDPLPRSSFPLVRVQITPVSPTLSLDSPSTSKWRIFYRLVFPSSSVIDFALPIPADSKITLHEAWGPNGRSVRFSSSTSPRADEKEERGLRVSADAPVREVLYEETKVGEDIVGAALLPFLGTNVGRYEVEVLEAQGYDLHIVVHDFDLSDRTKGSTSKFTKFLVTAETRPFLPLHFKPSVARPTSESSRRKKLTTLPTRSRNDPVVHYLALLPWFLIAIHLVYSQASSPTSLSVSPPPPARSTSLACQQQPPLISYSTVTLSTLSSLQIAEPPVRTTTTTTTTRATTTATVTMTVTHSQTFHHTYTRALTHYVDHPTPTLAPPPSQPSHDSETARSSFALALDSSAHEFVAWLQRLEWTARGWIEDVLRRLRIVA
ncbi:hypothetical protein JCM10212_006091 [Sporobolomyces blumeae]